MAEQPVGHQEPWRSLGDKVVMVTGASSGIGREFCVDLAKAGCRVIAAAHRTDLLQSLCDQINRFSSSSHSTPIADDPAVIAIAVELDVSADGLAIEASVQKAWNAFGRIDVLINNAGLRGNVRSIFDTSEEEWNYTLKTNLTGAWLVSKFVCIRMRDVKLGGSIINISSAVGLPRGLLPGAAAYVVSKTGLNVLTKVLALELGEHKIKVNSISPEIFKSEITEKLMQMDWFGTVVKRVVPLKDLGTTDPALTSLVRYLIHDSSKYVTGNIFIVDAGATLPGIPIFSSL
ncbi:hypothetical protein Nepgr_022057 [Nepenthes gracilis]|uniref:Uncharacterized protein n=1 Tax=Nepenthes gracilis TaxID=150966 RepID=A0AAD3T041_NEPGR|nr:hypothetical protein Nepgr_022057 [Nepenthes gracilis]